MNFWIKIYLGNRASGQKCCPLWIFCVVKNLIVSKAPEKECEIDSCPYKKHSLSIFWMHNKFINSKMNTSKKPIIAKVQKLINNSLFFRAQKVFLFSHFTFNYANLRFWTGNSLVLPIIEFSKQCLLLLNDLPFLSPFRKETFLAFRYHRLTHSFL